MIYTHSDLLIDQARERRDTLLREAQQQRILCKLAAERPGRWEQLRNGIGDTLIRAGTHLQERSSHSDSPSRSPKPRHFAYHSHAHAQK